MYMGGFGGPGDGALASTTVLGTALYLFTKKPGSGMIIYGYGIETANGLSRTMCIPPNPGL